MLILPRFTNKPTTTHSLSLLRDVSWSLKIHWSVNRTGRIMSMLYLFSCICCSQFCHLMIQLKWWDFVYRYNSEYI